MVSFERKAVKHKRHPQKRGEVSWRMRGQNLKFVAYAGSKMSKTKILRLRKHGRGLIGLSF